MAAGPRLQPLVIVCLFKEILGQDGNLSPVSDLELSHDVAKMDFNCMLAHTKLIGDLLISHPLTERFDDHHLPFCQKLACFGHRWLLVAIELKAADRHKCSAGFHQAHSFNGNIEW